MDLLCTADRRHRPRRGLAASTDLQVQAAFPVTEEQWAAGERNYYCFANRAGGEPLTGSIAGPGPRGLTCAASGRVVVVGSLNVDSTSYVETFPAPGETILSHGFQVALGGKGSNQAVAAHVVGASVDLVARIGTDAAGDFALATLERFGVPTTAVARETDAPTGVAQITVADSGENTIIVTGGANLALDAGGRRRRARTHRRGHPWCSPRASCPWPTIERVAEVAAEAGVRFVLNLAPPGPGQRGDAARRRSARRERARGARGVGLGTDAAGAMPRAARSTPGAQPRHPPSAASPAPSS